MTIGPAPMIMILLRSGRRLTCSAAQAGNASGVRCDSVAPPFPDQPPGRPAAVQRGARSTAPPAVPGTAVAYDGSRAAVRGRRSPSALLLGEVTGLGRYELCSPTNQQCASVPARAPTSPRAPAVAHLGHPRQSCLWSVHCCCRTDHAPLMLARAGGNANWCHRKVCLAAICCCNHMSGTTCNMSQCLLTLQGALIGAVQFALHVERHPRSGPLVCG